MVPLPQRSLNILVVEDGDEDYEALHRTISKVAPSSLTLHRCLDGDDALDFLHRAGKYVERSSADHPDLIFLDLNLPGTSGREVLAEIKQDDRLKVIPVVVLTTSQNPKDIAMCYQLAANSYLLKPMNIAHLQDSMRILLDYWFKIITLPSSVIIADCANHHISR